MYITEKKVPDTIKFLLIVPFVMIYTKGVKDANYYAPLFAMFLVLAFVMFCYRTVYYTLIKAAGHFKETQTGAIIEVVLNLSISRNTRGL